MKVLSLINLQHEESQIFYLRKYTSDVMVELPRSTEKVKINFSIEVNGLGQKNFNVDLLNQIDYPLIPLKKAILEYIIESDRDGKLNCNSL